MKHTTNAMCYQMYLLITLYITIIHTIKHTDMVPTETRLNPSYKYFET